MQGEPGKPGARKACLGVQTSWWNEVQSQHLSSLIYWAREKSLRHHNGQLQTGFWNNRNRRMQNTWCLFYTGKLQDTFVTKVDIWFWIVFLSWFLLGQILFLAENGVNLSLEMKEIFHFLSHFKKMLTVRFFLLKIYYNLGQLYRVGNQCKFGSRIVLNIQVCLSLVLLKAILIWLSYEALRMHSLNTRVDPELIIFLINLLKLHLGPQVS